MLNRQRLYDTVEVMLQIVYIS